MIFIKLFLFCSVLVATSKCEGNPKERMQNFFKLQKECREQHGFTEEIRANMKKQFPDGLYKPESVPKEYLCSMKCVDEKLELLKDGKFVVQSLIDRKSFMKSLKTPEKYMECLEELSGIKECEDYRKKVKCDTEFGDTYMRECAIKYNMDEFATKPSGGKRGKDKNHQCFHKCIKESKGIINKEGKIDLENVREDGRMMWNVKNKDKFFSCLKDVEIKECEDMSKIRKCKENN